MNNYFGCTRDCPDRHPGCHGSCEKYCSAKKQYMDNQAVIRDKRHKVSVADAAKRDAIKRCAGGKRR